MKFWKEAERCGVKTLYESAINHLVGKRPYGKTLKDVPGFTDAIQSHDKPFRDLVEALSDNESCSQEEIARLKKEVSHLRGRVKQLQGEDVIWITVLGCFSIDE